MSSNLEIRQVVHFILRNMKVLFAVPIVLGAIFMSVPVLLEAFWKGIDKGIVDTYYNLVDLGIPLTTPLSDETKTILVWTVGVLIIMLIISALWMVIRRTFRLSEKAQFAVDFAVADSVAEFMVGITSKLSPDQRALLLQSPRVRQLREAELLPAPQAEAVSPLLDAPKDGKTGSDD